MDGLVVHPLIGIAPRQRDESVGIDGNAPFRGNGPEARSCWCRDGSFGHGRAHIMDFRMLNVECSMLNVEWKRRLAIGALLFHSTFNIQHSTFAAEQAQFQPALPGYDYSFPRDHGTHDDYKTEWWYYTG